MKFNIYDILSKIIPGGVIYAVLFYFFKSEFEIFSEVTSIIIMYVIGYLIEVIASSSERGILFKTFGGNPVIKLLEGRKFIQIKLYQLEEVNQMLDRLFPNTKDDKLKTFLSMYSQVNKKEYPRLKEFLEAYVFARNLLVSILIAIIIYQINAFSWMSLIISIIIFLIAWVRTKQRNYYFSKEVIETFYEEEKINQNKV